MTNILPKWILVFYGKDSQEVYGFQTKREAIEAKRDWEEHWVSSETPVIYKAELTEVRA